MTERTNSWLVVTLLSLISLGPFAQRVSSQQDKRPRFPAWVSDQGYWVIESNIEAPLDHIVRFYNNDNELIYQETLTGIKLNPDKRKVKMKLKKLLEARVLALEKKKDGLIVPEEVAVIRSVFR